MLMYFSRIKEQEPFREQFKGKLHTHQTCFILSASKKNYLEHSNTHSEAHTHTHKHPHQNSKIINIACLYRLWEYRKNLDMHPPTICESQPIETALMVMNCAFLGMRTQQTGGSKQFGMRQDEL